jgi:hypothetical protein
MAASSVLLRAVLLLVVLTSVPAETETTSKLFSRFFEQKLSGFAASQVLPIQIAAPEKVNAWANDVDTAAVAQEMVSLYTKHAKPLSTIAGDISSLGGEACDFECAGAGVASFFSSAALCAEYSKSPAGAISCITLGCPVLVAAITEGCLKANPSCKGDDNGNAVVDRESVQRVVAAAASGRLIRHADRESIHQVAAAFVGNAADLGRLGDVLMVVGEGSGGDSKEIHQQLLKSFEGISRALYI